MRVIYILIKWWSLPIDQDWWNVWCKASRSQQSALIFPQACMLPQSGIWSDSIFYVKKKEKKRKWVTPLGKAVWRLSSLMALPLASILYHHTSQPPYLLPGRLVLLSISSLAPKCPSIICHGIFSPAALTPGLLFPCLLRVHIPITSHFSVFPPKIPCFL